MKTLKIGRNSTNDIVINDVTVSSQHAVITILDTKEVRIKDLNSTNGTYVNGRRITEETTITASDVIKVGKSSLDWVEFLNEKKNLPPPSSGNDGAVGKKIKSIGRNTDNDIVLNHANVSGSHAQLIRPENGEIVIIDNGSTNGTFVNGKKVSTQTLQPGDRVLIANEYPLDWQNVFGAGIKPIKLKKSMKIRLIAMIAVADAVLIVVLFFLFKDGEKTPEQIYAQYEKSVVMIYLDAPCRVTMNGYVGYENANAGGTGTGFFVSQDGKIITNRHVAVPSIDNLKSRYARKYGVNVNRVNVELLSYSIGIAINNTYLNNPSDIIPCQVLEVSDIEEVDIALMQVNSKTLPAGVTTVVDLNKAVVDDKNIVVGKPVYSIGFPAGIAIGNTQQGIQANNQDGKITQLRGKYEFGHNIAIIGGASGSPVFNQQGNLIGIIYAGTASHGYGLAVKAKYAVELAK